MGFVIQGDRGSWVHVSAALRTLSNHVKSNKTNSGPSTLECGKEVSDSIQV